MLKENSLRAVLWMTGAVLSFSLMAISVRELQRHMGVPQILFLRTLVTFLLVLAVLPRIGIAPLHTRRFSGHLARSAFHLGGQTCWMYAIGALPLATVFAIEFTMPVWVAVLAVFVLGERMSRGRLVALVMGLAGVAIILRPGMAPFHWATLVMLLGAAGFAGNMIMTKRLSSTDSPYAVLFWMSATQLPITLAAAVPGWVQPAAADLPWIFVVGAGSYAAHYTMTRAMKLGDATLVVPIDFLRLPLIAVVGALFYDEPLEAAVFVGAAVIFAGTYYSLARERA